MESIPFILQVPTLFQEIYSRQLEYTPPTSINIPSGGPQHDLSPPASAYIHLSSDEVRIELSETVLCLSSVTCMSFVKTLTIHIR